jgi:diaminopimelate epimerase
MKHMTSSVIRFTKMHGLGNDFMVIDNIDQVLNSKHLPISQLGNRHTGIGFDQLLLIERGQQADFFIRIFNADGSEAEQCGNGLRCVARLIHEDKLSEKSTFTLATKAGIFSVAIKNYDHITVSMGMPTIQENQFELVSTHHHSQPEKWLLSTISIGNPHAILKVEAIESAAVEDIGPAISTHPHFTHGANVGFMQVIDRQHIRLRTYERGTGETLACGSNACAAAIAGIINHWVDRKIVVEFSQGNLEIEWKGDDQPIQMTGPACRVFSGAFPLSSRT